MISHSTVRVGRYHSCSLYSRSTRSVSLYHGVRQVGKTTTLVSRNKGLTKILAARCCCCCCRCAHCRSDSFGASLCLAVSSISRPTVGVVGKRKKKLELTQTHISVGGESLFRSPTAALRQSHGLILLLIQARIRRPWPRAAAAAAVATGACFVAQAVCLPLLFVRSLPASQLEARGKIC